MHKTMARDRSPSKTFTPLGDVLSKVLQSCHRETHEPLVKIEACWQQAFDSTITANARPTALKGTLLMVQVTSPAWSHSLQFQKKEMTAMLNEALGEALVSDIKFTI